MPPVDKPHFDRYDIVFIGGGSGGSAGSRRAASYGKKVACVEVQNRLGGTCVNVGCVPKKIMWHAADLMEKLKQAGDYNFTGIDKPSFDWKTFKPRRDAFIKRLNAIYDKNFEKEHVEYHHGLAKVLSPSEVEVTREDGTMYTLKTEYICVAVGGEPTVPSEEEIPGASLGITSDGFFDLEDQPKRVAVIGAGYIAVELAGVFNALGTETHLIIRGETVLRTFDDSIQQELTSWMAHSGVKFHKGSKVFKVEGQKGQTLTVHTDRGEKIEVDTVLWAIGRHASTAGLGLKEVGVELDKAGNVVVDDYQNTNVPKILALGDVAGKWLLTPVAIAAARRMSNRLFGPERFKDDKLSYENIPTVVFSHPTIGTVGLTEKQAVEIYGADQLKIYRAKFKALYFNMIEEEHREPTFYKLICVGPEERVVGVHIIGMGSDEAMQGFGIAVKMKARKQDLDDTVAIHPTSAEEMVTLR